MTRPPSVRLFGPLVISVDGEPVRFKTRPIESLFLRLAISPDEPIARIDVQADVWPDVPISSAGNRLRTTLVLLKHALEPWSPIRAERTTIKFDSTEADLDLVEATGRVRKARLLWDREEEREGLHKLLSIIRLDLLQDINAHWIDEPRALWKRHRVETLLRLTHLAIEATDNEEALRLTELALLSVPFHPGAWGTYLRLMAKAGSAPQATERFRETRAELRKSGADFSSEIIGLARHVHAGGIKAESQRRELRGQEREIASATIERAFTSDPKLLLALIGSPAFRAEVFQRPRDAFLFATSIIDRTEGNEPDRVRAMRAVLAAGINLNQHERTKATCEWLIQSTGEETTDHRYAAMQLGFMHFELRNWSEAHRWTNRFAELARQFGGTYDEALGNIQIGSLCWHEGDYDKGEELYSAALKGFRPHNDLRDTHNLAALQLNIGFLKCMRRDFQNAEVCAQKAWHMALAHGLESVRMFAASLLGMCQVFHGDDVNGRKLVVEGITTTYRNRSLRIHEINMDLAAAVLAHLGHHAEATAVLDAYAAFRDGRNHARSVAESSFEDWIREKADQAKPRKDWLHMDQRAIIEKVCDLLERQAE